VKWDEVAKMAFEGKITPDAALGKWILKNLGNLNETIIQLEVDTRMEAGGARGIDDVEIPESEKEDSEKDEYLDMLGDRPISPA